MITESAILTHPKWQSNSILSNAGSQYKQLWFFAIFWNAITWAAIILGGDNILKSFDENPVFYFFVLFPFIGIWVFYSAVRETLAWRKFGITPLTLDTFPGQLGGLVAGYVDLPVAHNRKHQVKITLNCKHHYWRRSAGESEKTYDVLWQDRITVRTRSSSPGSRIRFSFNPPVDMPESQPDGTLERGESYEWEVHMQLSLPGHDFDRKFIIPVTHASEQAIAASSKQTRQTIEPLNQVDDSVNTNIPQISQYLGGTRFHYPKFRNKGLGIGLIITGVTICVFLGFMHQEFWGFMPATSMVFFGSAYIGMLALAALGLALILRSLTVDISSQSVNIKHKVFGFSFTEQILVSSIADIKAKKSGHTTVGDNTRIHFDLKLIQKDGSESTIGDSLDSSQYAESIREQVINSLGSEWKTKPITKVEQSKKRPLPWGVKLAGKILPMVFPFALIYDMRERLFEIFHGLSKLIGL